MAQKPSFLSLESTAITTTTTTTTMTGNDKKKNNRSQNSFSSQAHKILDSIKNSPYFLRKRSQNDPQSLKGSVQSPVAKPDNIFHVLYKGNVEVRSARIHDAIFGVSQLVTDPTQYAPTCRTDKGENIHDHYATELISVKVNKTEISIDGSGANVRLPLIYLAYCATDLRVPQVVSIVTNISNDFVCYALVCPNRVKAHELVTNINQTFETLWREWKRKERQESQKEDEKIVNDGMAYEERQKRSEVKRGGEKSKKK